MLKHNYGISRVYAAPGTQYRIYGDGNYVGDNPLGPFEYVEDNPFSFKPGGFIGGAGHGHTFKDKYGNYWHVASMTISVRHWFERRLGLFPCKWRFVIAQYHGGDVESGLAKIAEMVASLSKPTVSLVLGGSHSIGVPVLPLLQTLLGPQLWSLRCYFRILLHGFIFEDAD